MRQGKEASPCGHQRQSNQARIKAVLGFALSKRATEYRVVPASVTQIQQRVPSGAKGDQQHHQTVVAVKTRVLLGTGF